ncbi:alpha-ketoacid dehydrogenase subunit beta [Corallococcus carmarthensis]|uniref:3-methyl-2-oxobutanoate dehydrogenase (2-methylpropanoyl-transferring) n=1 Tax=Corallococcus carmarthensis TaxID=2316728 RepID=A0A3A8K245_9BACT|nr:transketolase C-terminal domain-containing protein [Corallococcus carmarthensis]NOK21448.1 alpha-ketoacid dehydrogenase subunit beta [Corallococcus carmarthensis]RKG98534.1 alpha-ketoacid dehydrogenase subunit beta [Corallococcus carmarthensis]
MANMAQAIRMALHYAEENLGVTDIFGEDVGAPLGGVFTCTQGLKTAWNSPLDERGIIGTAMGLAMAGNRPVAEIQFCDYIYNTIDLLKLVGNTHWSTNGDWAVPMVVRTPVGSGIRGSLYHSHSFDATMTHIPGWKVVMPSTPLDAYGLLISACQDPNPVMFLEPKALLRVKGDERIPGEPDDDRALSKMIDAPLGDRSQWKPQWPTLEAFAIPIGKGKVVREGTQATVISYGRTMPLCTKAAVQLAEEGLSVEVIDLRSLWPYDWELIKASVQKTGRVLFVNEDTEVTNFGEHLVRRTVEELFYSLLAPPRLVAGKFIPGIGLADALEMASVPQQNDVTTALRNLCHEQP